MTKQKMYRNIQNKFTELFHTKPNIYQAPGRINVIGEHTDYNEGLVLPAAINKYMVFGVQKNKLNKFRFYSVDYDEYLEFDEIKKHKDVALWSLYLLGVLAQFEKNSLALDGFDCVFGGDIPLGAGLSSSAALASGFAFAINDLSNFNLSSFDLVKIAQIAEHEYAGVMCGIMDQYASLFGKKDQLIQLDCKSNTHHYFPLKMNEYIFALVDTKVKHSLASTEYNLRKHECNEGIKFYQNFDSNITSLRNVDIKMIEEYKGQPNKTSYKRCKFVVEENERVKQASQALLKNDYIQLGKLIYQSHIGLQKLYEVSCTELDFLVEETHQMPQVLGSRMMGGGFGGCTLNLLEKDFTSHFEQIIKAKYKAKFGINANVYFISISEGVKNIINN